MGYETEVIIDLMEGGEDEVGDGNPHTTPVVPNQEICLLSFQIRHLYHELYDACTDADCQLIIMKRKLACLSNNLTCLSNRPGMLGYKGSS